MDLFWKHRNSESMKPEMPAYKEQLNPKYGKQPLCRNSY